MKTIKQLNEARVPVIVFDEKLEQLRDTVLFPEKLKKANKILSKAGLPQNLKK